MTGPIYQPRGAAREYAPLACNLYRGCTHGCHYCYAPACMRRKREDFHLEATPRPGIIDALERQLARERVTERVLLSFSCDPYPLESSTTHEALLRLIIAGVPVSLLSKSGLRMARDFDLLRRHDAEVGVSLVWADDSKRVQWEPGAAPVAERLGVLRAARALGLRTWASVEPVIEPEEALCAIELLMPLTDMIKVGRWNHDARANAIDWPSFVARARALLGSHPHVFKKGLVEL
jgi:DNA repair photolyase